MINHKLKICKGCNQPKVYYRVGYCKHCSTRNDIKNNNGKPKYTYKRKPTGELPLFKRIWNTRPHICTNCQDPLTSFNISYFSHILSKKRHPELRLDPNNIRLLCVKCHYAFDFRGKKAFEALTKPEPSVNKIVNNLA